MIGIVLALAHLIISFYLVVAIFRFYLPLIRADYYNPLSQFVAKLTNPFILPMRRFIPSMNKYDSASLALILLVQLAEVGLLISYTRPSVIPLFTIAFAMLANILFLFGKAITYALIIVAVASWVNPYPNSNPALSFLHSITLPFTRFVQRRVPPLAGIDFSPMIVIIGLVIIRRLIETFAIQFLPHPYWFKIIVEPLYRF